MALCLDVESVAEIAKIVKPTEGLVVRMYRDGDFETVKDLWKKTGLDNPARGDTQQVYWISIHNLNVS